VAAPDTYYDVAMRRLDEQMSRIGDLDSKAATVLAAATALLPIFGALLAVFATDPSVGAIILFVIAFVIYLGMVWRIFLGTRVGDWDLRPNLSLLASYAAQYDERTVKKWVAKECARAIETNAPKLETKATNVGHALVGLVAVGVFLAAAAFCQLIS
jgi:hypothetical protein